MTTPSKYFPPQTPIEVGRNRKIEITMTKEKRGRVQTKLRIRSLSIDIEADGPDANAQLRAGLQRVGLLGTDPMEKRSKPAGSSPALRIACPVCLAAPGTYCEKLVDYKLVQQTIAHKRRRAEEERTR